MKTTLKKIYFFSAILTALTISSCKKNESPTPVEPSVSTSIQSNLASPVKQDDYLVFKDQDNLLAFQKEYVNKKQDELDKWEQRLNFISYRKLFSQVAAEMEKIETQEQYDAAKSKYNSTVKFCTDGTIDYLYMPNYAPFINRDGIVKVGNVLYKFMEDRVIFILDGDKSKINTALSLNESKPDQNVVISYIEKSTTLNKTRAVTAYSEINEQIGYNLTYNGSENEKLEVWVHFYRMYVPLSCGWSTSIYLNINLKSSIKKLFGGGWKEKTCSLSSGGSYNLGVNTPPPASSCTGLTYYSGPLIASGNFGFGPESSSNRIWQIYGGADIWQFSGMPQNVVYSLTSNSYSHCVGWVAVNK